MRKLLAWSWIGCHGLVLKAVLLPAAQGLGYETVPPDNTPAATRPAFDAVGYFINNCSRCHGDYGENYLPGSLAKRDDASLNKILREMCEGPGNAPVDDDGLKRLADYHRAMQKSEPFAAFDSPASGSLTPDTTIAVKNGAAAKVEAGRFTFDAPPSADATFVLTRSGRSVERTLAR
jgi:hypothetical protein